MTKYEIWLADVPFEEKSNRKIRPVLILDDKKVYVLCNKNETET